MHTDLIYCVVTISNTWSYIRSDVTHFSDAANGFSEKTNNYRNLHTTYY